MAVAERYIHPPDTRPMDHPPVSARIVMRNKTQVLMATVLLGFGGTYQGGRTQARNTLDIYSIDVEGGQSTLYVSPSGQSMLVDAGNPGARDADRIAAVAKQARWSGHAV